MSRPSRRRATASAGARAIGIGQTYAFRDPDGHEFELYWDSERYQAPPSLAPALKNQAEAKPAYGVGVRRLDHVNSWPPSVEPNGVFQREILGARPASRSG